MISVLSTSLVGRLRRLIALVTMTLLLCVGLSSCDGMGEMCDDLTQKVPVCVDSASTAAAPDGRGWKNAYTTINDAENNAPAGSEIWIKKGTYTLTATINVSKNISLYGGFDGNESRRGDRSSDAALTIINGNGMQIMTVTGSSGKIVIDGITFSHGNSGSGGGAISVTGASSLIVRNSFFSVNTTTGNGGAIASIGTGVISISGSTFTGNETFSSGGAIYCSGGSLEVSDCMFGDKNLTAITPGVSNVAAINGGAVYTSDCDTNIKDSYFYYNNTYTASTGGGGVCLSGTGTGYIGNCSFVGNRIDNGARGGGVLLYSKTMTIDHCFIKENNATNDGGGVCVVETSAPPKVKITHTIISENTCGGSGGGMWQQEGELEIKNSLICDNINGSDTTQVDFNNSSLMFLLYNCTIISYNRVTSAYTVVGNLRYGTIINCVIFGSDVNLTNNFLYNVATNIALGDYTENNNPQTINESDFVNFAARNYRPSSSSRLRNNGRTVSGIGNIDLDGNPRVRGTIDIGAYEYQ
jgi:predicted outer membrane repeat protein